MNPSASYFTLHRHFHVAPVDQPVRQSPCFNWLCESAAANQLCTRCRVARYCSSRCQLQNWLVHKPTCSHHFSGVLGLADQVRSFSTVLEQHATFFHTLSTAATTQSVMRQWFVLHVTVSAHPLDPRRYSVERCGWVSPEEMQLIPGVNRSIVDGLQETLPTHPENPAIRFQSRLLVVLSGEHCVTHHVITSRFFLFRGIHVSRDAVIGLARSFDGH